MQGGMGRSPAPLLHLNQGLVEGETPGGGAGVMRLLDVSDHHKTGESRGGTLSTKSNTKWNGVLESPSRPGTLSLCDPR